MKKQILISKRKPLWWLYEGKSGTGDISSENNQLMQLHPFKTLIVQTSHFYCFPNLNAFCLVNTVKIQKITSPQLVIQFLLVRLPRSVSTSVYYIAT